MLAWTGEHSQIIRDPITFHLHANALPHSFCSKEILHSWKKKTAVAIHKSFFATLPRLKQVEKSEADIAWLIYDLVLSTEEGTERYHLKIIDEIYTQFESALLSITTATPGDIENFIKLLQKKLDDQLETPPINAVIDNPL